MTDPKVLYNEYKFQRGIEIDYKTDETASTELFATFLNYEETQTKFVTQRLQENCANFDMNEWYQVLPGMVASLLNHAFIKLPLLNDLKEEGFEIFLAYILDRFRFVNEWQCQILATRGQQDGITDISYRSNRTVYTVELKVLAEKDFSTYLAKKNDSKSDDEACLEDELEQRFSGQKLRGVRAKNCITLNDFYDDTDQQNHLYHSYSAFNVTSDMIYRSSLIFMQNIDKKKTFTFVQATNPVRVICEGRIDRIIKILAKSKQKTELKYLIEQGQKALEELNQEEKKVKTSTNQTETNDTGKEDVGNTDRNKDTKKIQKTGPKISAK
jgi:hypothetical protein